MTYKANATLIIRRIAETRGRVLHVTKFPTSTELNHDDCCCLIYFEQAVIPRFFSYFRPTMHAASRHGTPSLTSLPKDGGVSCFGRSSGRSPIQFLTVHSYA